MAYHNLDKNLPTNDGTYIVQILTLQGYIREAKAIWQQQKGFCLENNPLKADEFIKSWWQY